MYKEIIMKDKKFMFFFLITKSLVNIMFFCGIPTTIVMPFFLKWYGQLNILYVTYYWFMVAFFVICGIMACLIVYELRKMLKSVEVENCFIHENVTSLRRMGTYSFVISLMAFCRLVIETSPSVFIVSLVFAIAALFSKVLANVFEAAIQYKEDNDLTI